jgi:uncharacterized protein (DUF1697 family)
MERYIAFLRGLNVGGSHRVKMHDLRRLFESCGLSSVETVIQSGNVVFESPKGKPKELEPVIESCLEKALGYRVATFLRTTRELAAVVSLQPFGPAEPATGATLNVAFLRNKPKTEVCDALRMLKTDNDLVAVGKREVYWLRRAQLQESTQFANLLWKTLKAETTVRNITTVSKIVSKYC